MFLFLHKVWNVQDKEMSINDVRLRLWRTYLSKCSCPVSGMIKAARHHS